MKGCLNESTLQAWLDGELTPEASTAAQSHLSTCSVCTARARDAEQALALVDDAWLAELANAVPAAGLRARVEEAFAQPAPADHSLWRVSFAHWQVGAAAAVLAIVVTAALVVRSNQLTSPAPAQRLARLTQPESAAGPIAQPAVAPAPAPASAPGPAPARTVGVNRNVGSEQRFVRNSARRPTWIESETNRHLEQTQLLLRSVRNAEDETALDYERELSRELLSRNRLLRRSVESKERRRAELLSHVEPILIDIANLPEQPAPEQMQSIRELIRDQQIIAELQLYTGRNMY